METEREWMKPFAEIELPSNRRFGLFMAAALLAIAAYRWTTHHPLQMAIAAVLAALFAGVAFLKPTLLLPLNRAWMGLGTLLGLVVSPIVLGILFFALFTPLAIILRLAGRDELRLRRLPAGLSYWRVRAPPGPQPDSFPRQF
jgi:tellurite resistance protein TehA-like permease